MRPEDATYSVGGLRHNQHKSTRDKHKQRNAQESSRLANLSKEKEACGGDGRNLQAKNDARKRKSAQKEYAQKEVTCAEEGNKSKIH